MKTFIVLTIITTLFNVAWLGVILTGASLVTSGIKTVNNQ